MDLAAELQLVKIKMKLTFSTEQSKPVEKPVFAQTPSCKQVSKGAKTPPQKVVPATGEVSNDTPVQPDERQMSFRIFHQ